MNTANPVFQKIQEQLNQQPVVLYMKGDRSFPQCGFSAQVVEILEQLGVSYQTEDVLMDPDLRSGLKEYANWPTFPQLYVNNKLVGGCDILMEMYQSGELRKLFQQEGLLNESSA